jgi:hypothetical protein
VHNLQAKRAPNCACFLGNNCIKTHLILKVLLGYHDVWWIAFSVLESNCTCVGFGKIEGMGESVGKPT